MRRTLRDLAMSRMPTACGLCMGDTPSIAALANEAQQNLINAAGETGWFGGWARLAFTASRINPYVTTPYQFARMIGFDVCRTPVRIQNEFYEVMDAGIGLRGPVNCTDACGPMEAYDRGTFPTMIDLTGSQYLKVYITNQADIGKQVLFTNVLDQNGNGIYTQSGSNSVNGFYMTLDSPSVQSPYICTSFQSFEKDQTYGDLVLVAVDPNTGNETTLSRYKPQETNPAYRRYYFAKLPNDCCGNSNTAPVVGQVSITAIGKYEFIPAQSNSDYLIIGNIPALIEECLSITYSQMETPNAMALEKKHHNKALKLLNDELRHYLGEMLPAINFAPFGTARLQCQGIGNMI